MKKQEPILNLFPRNLLTAPQSLISWNWSLFCRRWIFPRFRSLISSRFLRTSKTVTLSPMRWTNSQELSMRSWESIRIFLSVAWMLRRQARPMKMVQSMLDSDSIWMIMDFLSWIKRLSMRFQQWQAKNPKSLNRYCRSWSLRMLLSLSIFIEEMISTRTSADAISISLSMSEMKAKARSPTISQWSLWWIITMERTFPLITSALWKREISIIRKSVMNSIPIMKK